MLSQEYFTHYPSRLMWAGGGVLCALMIVSASLLIPMIDQPAFPLPPRIADLTVRSLPLSILFEQNHETAWELSSIENELFISLSPPRPLQEEGCNIAHVRLKSAQQSRRVNLPVRLFLCFNDRGVLGFQDNPGPFWADLTQEQDDAIRVQLTVVKNSVDKEQHIFTRRPDFPPLQKSEEFPAGSPLRVLGESRWLGADLVAQMNASEVKQRLEIGSTALNLGMLDWLAWKGGQWVKIEAPSAEKDMPLARIRSVSGPTIEFDIWDSSYTRLGITQQTPPIAHVKADEWIASLRIRSDRQLSCAIEKQLIVLRLGDWVLKENARWRVLRKAEEKKQVLDGTKNGDLFILEKIDAKQRCIKGKMFLANRTQMIPIEANALSKSFRHIPHSYRKGKA
jgi:hypothetical protein